MVNTDVTVTLAGQFAPLNPRQLRLVELAGKMLLDIGSGAAKPTIAQWAARLSTAVSLFQPQSFRNMQAQHAAAYWQTCVTTIGSGLAASGRSNNQILDIASYLQGFDDQTLDALSLYLEGKSCLTSSVYT